MNDPTQQAESDLRLVLTSLLVLARATDQRMTRPPWSDIQNRLEAPLNPRNRPHQPPATSSRGLEEAIDELIALGGCSPNPGVSLAREKIISEAWDMVRSELRNRG